MPTARATALAGVRQPALRRSSPQNRVWSLAWQALPPNPWLILTEVAQMRITSRVAVVIVFALLAPASVPHADTTPAGARDGARGFDFLVGEWRVRHRRIPTGGGDWVEFDGTLRLRLLMQGA